ncbi:DUF2313 domain-containing protein [Klebsiella sp. RHBSTW-00215]|uniref:YmfQ family protein n=1 Tax=Klebsiella sp. RHBSTW-00215 TaxID=2742640 RepID=UPI0015F47CC3|nr:putative phage tail protein [Klebsiella sp. RHBSTW-00215]MBA7932979.1 DUF2313 domain-containing protein [Klebsiella sp. RHBSTW-00215]
MSLYSVDDYTRALVSLLPTGLAWPRDVESTQYATVKSLAHSFARSDTDSLALLSGGFPSTALMMLYEWERTLGLPDDCAIGEIDSIGARQRAVVSKLISTGGLNRNYYITIAAALGYDVTIMLFRPAMCGMSVCGDAINGDEWPYTWQINVPGSTVRYAYSGETYCGDPLASWGDKQLECSINKIAPSHINIIFTYGLEAEMNTPSYQSEFDRLMNYVWPAFEI